VLGASATPLSLVFTRATGASPLLISAIAVFATINGVIAQIILAARVLYGLARQGNLHAAFGHVHQFTETPLVATGTATAAAMALALSVRLDQLAEMTTLLMLAVFCLVNAALITIKRRGDTPPGDAFIVSIWVPVTGLAACLVMLVAGLAL
jgi:basic amino acid/polyamine antiporter, APA family